jgi:hypothetical protein
MARDEERTLLRKARMAVLRKEALSPRATQLNSGRRKLPILVKREGHVVSMAETQLEIESHHGSPGVAWEVTGMLWSTFNARLPTQAHPRLFYLLAFYLLAKLPFNSRAARPAVIPSAQVGSLPHFSRWRPEGPDSTTRQDHLHLTGSFIPPSWSPGNPWGSPGWNIPHAPKKRNIARRKFNRRGGPITEKDSSPSDSADGSHDTKV